MKHLPLVTVLASAMIVLPLLTTAAFAVIVDRTAITAGTKVITESEIVMRIRLAAFQNGALPDLSAASRREAAQRLIDLKLVEREMDLGHYLRTSVEQAKALLKAFTTEHFSSSAEALRLALAAAELTPDDLQAELAEQADFNSFVDLRFRPAVEVGDPDIEKYYHENVEPKTGPNPPSLSDVRARIEEILTTQRADQELDVWLRDQRRRIKTNYLVKELR